MPRAGSTSTGGFSSGGGFSNPWGSPQASVESSSSSGSSRPDTGATPGGLGVDVSSPQAFIESMQQSGNEASNFLDGLGKAVFGKGTLFGDALQGVFGENNGSLLGGTPIGGLARGIGGVPGGIGDTVKNAGDIVGGAFEHVAIPLANASGEEMQSRYDALPADLKVEFDKQIAEHPDIKSHIQYQALLANADREQLTNPKLNPYDDIPRPTLADTLGYMLGPMIGTPQRLVERQIAGAGKVSGMNRLQELDAIAQGGRPTGVLGTGFFAGGQQLSDVEQIALSKWKSGEWSQDQALTFLAASGSGLSHDQMLQIAGTFSTDPTLIGSLGAAGLAKLGMTGAELAATETRTGAQLALREAGTAGRLNVLGKAAESARVNDLVRVIGKQYAGLEGTTLGRAAKITRTIIDPLHTLGEHRVAGEAAVDVLADAAPRSVIEAYGDVAYGNVMRYASSVSADGGMIDMLGANLSDYAANLGRAVTAEAHQADMLGQGLGRELVQSVPGDIIDDLLSHAPKDVAAYIKERAISVRKLVWDEPAVQNLADRMEAMYGFKTASEFAKDLAKMGDEERGLLHALTYGRATKLFLDAIGQSVNEYAGRLPLKRLVLLNRDTLTDIGAKGILARLTGEGSVEQALVDGWQTIVDALKNGATEVADPLGTGVVSDLKYARQQLAAAMKAAGASTLSTADKVAIIREAQRLYPDLRYISLDEANLERSVGRFMSWLQGRLDDGVIPSQVTREELKGMPQALQDMYEQMKGAWDFGFRPDDDKLWGLEYDLEGRYRPFTTPWVDHVADAIPAYRSTTSMLYNIAGQPLANAAVRTALKPIDYMLAAANTAKAKITSAQVTEAARARFSARAVKAGMTDAEAKQVFQGIVEAAGLQRTTARGLTERNMWEHVAQFVPKRLYQTGAIDKRSLMNLVLDAYEGDLRFVGLTQKLTGRAKRILEPIGGNLAGHVAEFMYPKLRYQLNALFQVQERIEPIVLNAQRGVNLVFGNKLSEADRLTQAILDRMADTSVTRVGDLDQWEYSAQALAGTLGESAVRRAMPRELWDSISNVQASKRVNLLRTFQHKLGPELHGAMERAQPGLWQDVKDTMSAQAGRVLSDDEVAVKWVAGQMFGSDVTVPRLLEPGMKGVDFDAAVNTAAWHVPTNLGELRPLDLDFLAKRMAFPLGEGRYTASANDLRAAIAAGDLTMDDVKDALTWHGAHPDYVRRVENALTFSWDGFWKSVRTRFSLSSDELTHVRSMMEKSAEVRRMTPVDFLSQVFAPTVSAGQGAAIKEMEKAVSILRTPVGKSAAPATVEDLMAQLTDIFSAHLDPSGQEALLAAFEKQLPGDIQAAYNAGKAPAGQALQKTLENLRGGWTKETNGAFAKAVLERMTVPAVKGAVKDPDVERAVQQFAKWSKSALLDGLLTSGANPYSDLLKRVAKIDTQYAVPFNKTHQLLVNQVMDAMRAKEQDAFRLQFFARSRTWAERAINHPFFGIYPASYMWGKIAPELIRFMAKEPFGLHTGAMAWAAHDVQKAVAIQREYDPNFDKAIDDLGHSQAVWFVGYMLPGVPWDVGAAAPSWVRDIAQQGLDNQARIDKGLSPKAIDFMQPMQKVADYISPFRSIKQTEYALSDVFGKQTPDTSTGSSGAPPTGPTKAVDLGPTLEEQMQALQQVLANQ